MEDILVVADLAGSQDQHIDRTNLIIFDHDQVPNADRLNRDSPQFLALLVEQTYLLLVPVLLDHVGVVEGQSLLIDLEGDGRQEQEYVEEAG